MTDSIWLWAPLMFALAFAAFFLARLTGRLLDVTRAQARMRSQNERMLGLIHQLVELENQKLLVEQELSEIVEREPVELAPWHRRVKQIVAGLPPLVVEEMRRFGLALPPEQAQMVPPAPRMPQFYATHQGRVLPVRDPRESMGPPPSSARSNGSVTQLDNWTGKARAQR